MLNKNIPSYRSLGMFIELLGQYCHFTNAREHAATMVSHFRTVLTMALESLVIIWPNTMKCVPVR